MEERNKVNVIPEHLAYYPMTPDECYKPEEEPLKNCPECHGLGIDLDAREDIDCQSCHGTGQVYMTEQDLADEMENEIIGNAEMMNDD